jgi:hypothetical protein
MATGVTAGFVAAQGRRVAQLDSPEGSVLLTAQSVAIALQEGLAMLAHDIGHFDLGSVHHRLSRAVGRVMSSGIRWQNAVIRWVDGEHGRTPSLAWVSA